jgi:L-iditol 2-dehydrogenase
MKSAFSTEARKVELRDVPIPSPQAGEALVRVRNCGVCGSDLHWFCGGFPPPPVCPGHEISGEVVDVGLGVTGLANGTRVAVEPMARCGHCAYCRNGNYQICPEFQIFGTHRDGGFAEHVLVPAYALFQLPAALDFEVGALTEPLAVCVHGVRLGGIGIGDRVLVLGAGTIGLLSVLAARAAGATEVGITARHPHQGAMAKRLGATHVFATTGDGARQLNDWQSDCPVDAVVETVGGTAETLMDAVGAVRRGGTVVVLGVYTSAPSFPALALVVKEVRVVGSLTYGRAGVKADFDIALATLVANAAAVREMITHRFPLAEIQSALETAADKRSGAIKVTVAA